MKQEEEILTLTRGNAVPICLRLRITAGGADVPVSACEDVSVALSTALGTRHTLETSFPTGGSNVLLLSLPATLPAGTYGVEVHGRYGEQDFRVAEERVLRIVEDNEGANIWDGSAAELPEMELSLWAAPLPSDGGDDKPVRTSKQRLVVVGKSIPAYSETHCASRELYYAFPARPNRTRGIAANRPCAYVTVSWRLDQAIKLADGDAAIPKVATSGYALLPHVQLGVMENRVRRKGVSIDTPDATHEQRIQEDLRDLIYHLQDYWDMHESAGYDALRSAASVTWCVDLGEDTNGSMLRRWIVVHPKYSTATHWLERIELLPVEAVPGGLCAASPQIIWERQRPRLLSRATAPVINGEKLSGDDIDEESVRDANDSLNTLAQAVALRYERTCRIYRATIILRVAYTPTRVKGERFRVWKRVRGQSLRAGRYLLRRMYRNLVAEEGTEYVVFMKKFDPKQVTMRPMVRPTELVPRHV